MANRSHFGMANFRNNLIKYLNCCGVSSLPRIQSRLVKMENCNDSLKTQDRPYQHLTDCRIPFPTLIGRNLRH